MPTKPDSSSLVSGARTHGNGGFAPTHVSTWFKPSWISARILKEPARYGRRIERGALVINQVDPLVELFPALRSLFILVERHGWFGMNESGYADIALVEDLSVWDTLCARDPDIIHLPLGPADFVDADAFFPMQTGPDHDVIQISCWSPRKRVELLIEAAARLPHRTFLHLGHFENGGSAEELEYRRNCLSLAKRLGARITFPFGHVPSNDAIPQTKSDVNQWINRARVGVLTALPEGINRFKMECMAADRPMLIAADAGTPTTKHINHGTGLLFEPTIDGLVHAIEQALTQRDRFWPRQYMMANTGRKSSLTKLRAALRESCQRTGGWYHFDDIEWDGRNESLKWGREGVALLASVLARYGQDVPEDQIDQIFAHA